MQTSVTKWGNSLAVRLPKPFMEQIGISDKSKVDIVVKDDCLILKKSKDNLDELLDRITEKNIHIETDTGKIIGKEIW